jgi:hypothetical protein
MSSENLWYGPSEEPQNVYVGDRIVVVSECDDGTYVDVWTMTEHVGWFSDSEGGSLQVSDCLRWAWEEDVIRQAIGGER